MRFLLLLTVIASTAGAQEDFGPPPMVQADVVDPRQGQVLTPPAISNQPIDPSLVQQPLPSRVPGTLTPQPAQTSPVATTVTRREEPSVNPRLLRAGMAALLGAGLGIATGIAGGFLGGEYLRPGLTSVGNIHTGGLAGFAIGAPLGVMIAGALFHGDAPWYAALLGDLIGTAAGIACIGLAGPDALSLGYLLPLAGSVVGYELGSVEDTRVVPTVTMTPGGQGATVGVRGTW